jgi:hypothetical protein
MQTNNTNLNKLFSHIERIKPNFGTISLELLFHQNKLSKVKNIKKQDVIVFDNKDEINYK